MNPLLTEVAQTLQKTVSDLYGQLEQSHTAYQSCIASAIKGEIDSETRFALRREGRTYAELLVRYSNAAMAWLAFVENQIRPDEQSRSTGK